MSGRPRTATLVGLALVAGAFIALVVVSLTSAVVYYRTPTEIANSVPGQTVRLYGVVVAGSTTWDAASKTLSFQITDGTTTIDVSSVAIPTALFRDGVAVVLVGHLVDRVHFAADELLVKHSEVYQPLKPGDTVPPGILEQIGQPGSTP